jgi:hypothetical protein
MKNALFFVFLFTSMILSGQPQQGKIQLNVDFGYSSSSDVINASGYTYSNDNENGLSVSPTLSYFASDKISIGATFIYQESNQESNLEGDLTYKLYYYTHGIGPTLGIYSMINDKLGLFAQGSVFYLSGTLKVMPETGADEIVFEGTGVGLQFKPGIRYYIHPKFAFEASFSGISYSKIDLKPSGGGDIKYTKKQLDMGFNMSSLQFGIVYYLK